MADGTSNYWGGKRWTEWGASDALNIDSDNDTIEYGWPFPVRVTRAAVAPTTTVANGSGTVEVEVYRNNDFGDAGTDTLLGTWVLGTTTSIVPGEVSVANFVGADTDGEAAEDGNTRYVGPTGPYDIAVGEGLVFKVVEPSDSGVVLLAVEYIPLPFNENDTNVVRVYNVPA